MKQVILVLFSIFILVSCKEKIKSVQDVMNTLAPDEQKSTIDPTVDNLIKGEKGTQIFIPANALRFKDGTIPAGRINIELKEFFSVSDFVSNNLSTMSDSFLLETNGMLYISATADGKELVIDNNKSYTIAFPKIDSTKSMELFYGDSSGSGNINWQPVFRNVEGAPDTTIADSTLYEKKITVCGYTSSIDGDDVLWLLNHSDSTLYRYVENNFKPTDTAVINALCDRGEIAGMTLEIDAKGKLSNIDFEGENSWRTTNIALRKAIADFFNNLPNFKMGSMARGKGKAVVLQLCCHDIFNWDKYKERFDKKYSQYRNKAIQKIDPTELKFYVMSATRFGWINCDRFYDDGSEKIDYIVKIPKASGSKVMIVFDDLKSIMNAEIKDDEAVFKNIPISSKVKVIGIQYQEGKPMMSKMPAIVNRQSFTLSGFKEFTLKELETELNN